MLQKTRSAGTEFYSFIRNKIRQVKYVIADTPSFCKDLFRLKCNQFTMRDCAMKNFAIQYIDINSRNAEIVSKEAEAKGDSATARRFMYISEALQMYVDYLEKQKQFLVKQKGMTDEAVGAATARHPSLFKRSADE